MPKKAVPLPPHEELQHLLDYSVITGKLYWRESRGGATIKGSKAGFTAKNGYVLVTLNNRQYRAHRVIWKLVTGSEPMGLVDHADQIRSNNSWHNLREATVQQNAQNQGKSHKNTSGYKGVSWEASRLKFRARIRVGGHLLGLGSYVTAQEAHAAYCEAAIRCHGEFARFD